MAGAYCKFCGDRCFLERWVPGESATHFATCPKGMALDREATGYDHTTAFNPRLYHDTEEQTRAYIAHYAHQAKEA